MKCGKYQNNQVPKAIGNPKNITIAIKFAAIDSLNATLFQIQGEKSP
jgi:hypothetical protein